MSEIIEHVARAIKAKLDKEFDERGGLTSEEMADIAARAAIEDIRDIEPTDGMMKAMWSLSFSNTEESFAACWHAMIDAALSDGGE
jgi:hypothetical protein